MKTIGGDTHLRIRGIMEDAHALYMREVKFYTEMRRLLEKFAGKRVDTKRTITYITSIHPSWTVSFKHIANSHTSLRVWGGDSSFKSYDDAGCVMLGYNNELHNYDLALLDKYNPGIESAKHEMKRIEDFLNTPENIYEIAETIDNFNALREKIVPKISACPQSYAVLKLLAVTERK